MATGLASPAFGVSSLFMYSLVEGSVCCCGDILEDIETGVVNGL